MGAPALDRLRLAAAVRDIVRNDYATFLTLNKLAEKLLAPPHEIGISPVVLGTEIRKFEGKGLREWLTDLRLAEAEPQVRAGVKVTGIAASLGYGSKKNFYRAWMKRYGMSPRAWRQAQDAAAAEKAS